MTLVMTWGVPWKILDNLLLQDPQLSHLDKTRWEVRIRTQVSLGPLLSRSQARTQATGLVLDFPP